MKSLRKFKFLIILLIVVMSVFTIWANHSISSLSQPFLSDDITNIKPVKVGLLLGTSKFIANGTRNDFFYNRIEATVNLFRNNKIKFVLVSGDNGKSYYNEPQDMRDALMEAGIPDSLIILDYAGFRTFDSVLRAKEIFGQDSLIIISQKFHNERAVFIARKNSINAFGYNAKEVAAFGGFRTKLREIFARDKVFLDFAFGVKPKYLGDKVKIG
jgi:SanA protein